MIQLMSSRSNFSIFRETKSQPPRLAFRQMKEVVLGPRYELNFIFAGPAKLKKLNRLYRRKNKVTNVLSFALNRFAGEIYICPAIARREARYFEFTSDNFIGFLFIHSLLHLKGYAHGSRMERKEAELLKKFRLSSSPSNRPWRKKLPSE